MKLTMKETWRFVKPQLEDAQERLRKVVFEYENDANSLITADDYDEARSAITKISGVFSALGTLYAE